MILRDSYPSKSDPLVWRGITFKIERNKIHCQETFFMRDEFLRNNTNKKNRMSDLEFEITLTESDEDGDYVPSGSEG